MLCRKPYNRLTKTFQYRILYQSRQGTVVLMFGGLIIYFLGAGGLYRGASSWTVFWGTVYTSNVSCLPLAGTYYFIVFCDVHRKILNVFFINIWMLVSNGALYSSIFYLFITNRSKTDIHRFYQVYFSILISFWSVLFIKLHCLTNITPE